MSRNSLKQIIVALSTTKAEMIALVDAYKEYKSVHELFEECTYTGKAWTTYKDNQACIQIAHEIDYSEKAKHINLCYLAVQDLVSRGQIHL